MTVYFARHGQSEFNAAYDGKRDPIIPDAPLTSLGKLQAKSVRQQVRQLGIARIITSPLTRAIETALLVSDGKIQIEVWEQHREILKHSCDIGRPPDALKLQFPQLHFGHLEEIWWHEQEYPLPSISKEPANLYKKRLDEFLFNVRRLEEPGVIVIGHGNAFQEILGRMLDHCELQKYK